MMGRMTQEEIAHLARLSRIALTDTEVTSFREEIGAILEYVGAVNRLVSSHGGDEPTVGEVFNVFRSDEVTHPSGQCAEALLAAMPDRHGRYLKVKKIIDHG
jgi:aspartyl-tRNA(Asn)/glutamyl-tRNA(Gln) amidotransferase subunit C